MLPSPSELTYFSEVAHSASLIRAAKKLGITQPSLSMAIKKLEHTLGTPLFIRHKNGMSLTPAGETLLTQVKLLLQHWENTTIKAKASHEEVQGRVTIGCRSVTAFYLGSFLLSLLEKHPKLEIHFKHQHPQKTTEKVINSLIDIGIVPNPSQHDDLVIKQIGKIEMNFFVGDGERNIQDIHSGQAVIICEPNVPQKQFFLKEFQKENIKFARMITTNSLDVVARLTIEGCGIGILPTCFAKKTYPNQLRPVVNMPVYFNEMCLIYRYENKHVQAISTVVTALKDFIANSSA